MPAAPTISMLPQPLRQALESMYSEVDAEVRALGVACWARGDCCDFERCEHKLYASSIEIAYVAEAHGAEFPRDSVLCPFWLDGKCTERARRPLGCRTYFCDRRFKDALEAIYEKHYRRLRRTALEQGFEWAYEPFVAALRKGSAVSDGGVKA